MANFFDQFDAPAQAPQQTGGPLRLNLRMGEPATQGTGGGNFFDKFDAPEPNFLGMTGGVYKAADAGIAKGIAGLIGAPDAVANLGAEGIDAATKYFAGLLGIEHKRPDVGSPTKGMLPTTEGTKKLFEDTFYGGQPLYKPRNDTERYVQGAAEFVPGAMAGPGGVVGNAIRYGILPGLAATGAGDIPGVKGSVLEEPVKVGAALAAGGVAAIASRPGTAAKSIRQSLPEGVTPQMVDQAGVLMNDAAQRGITLSWPEALSQVAGRPVLSDMARHLEASGPTQGRMADFYAQRPQQVEAAGRGAMDTIAPVNNAPSTIGHQAGQAAEETIDGARQTINRAAEPFYRASEGVLLNPAEMARVRALPGYAEAAATVRNEPQLNRYVAHLPENSVGFLNEVKKQLDHSATAATAPLSPRGAPNAQISAGYTRDAAATRQTGVNASRNYETALNIEEQGRRRFLDPLLQGPLGKIASRDTTTKQAIEALFPTNPLPNSAQEIATAVGALAHRSPRIAGDLVRAHTESVFNEATQALMGGAAQAGGAKFRAVLVGNAQQRANFEAAVTALPNGADRLAGFNRFLDVMEAIGTRQNIGSKTAYNAEFLKDASQSGIVGEVVKGAANPVSRFTQGLVQKYEAYKLGRNLNELANILTNPAAVGQLRAIARMPPGSRQAEAAAFRILALTNAGATSGVPVNQPRQ
jgi:hypothetical protein